MWYAVHDVTTGRLRSLGTVLPPQLPDGLAALPLGATAPDLATTMWDDATRGFLPRPPKLPPVDRLDDVQDAAIFAELRAAIAGITNTTQRAALVSALRLCLGRLLGRYRYREADEEVTLG